jgi:hypothetical protein
VLGLLATQERGERHSVALDRYRHADGSHSVGAMSTFSVNSLTTVP